jgi:transcriptional regulator with XRE-family HTH domain
MPIDNKHHNLLRGRVLQKWREYKGFSQAKLADVLSVTAQTIHNWEKGKGWQQIDTLASLCEALGISIEFLANIDRECGFEDTKSDTLDTDLRNESRLQVIRRLVCTNDCETSSLRNGKENEQ